MEKLVILGTGCCCMWNACVQGTPCVRQLTRWCPHDASGAGLADRQNAKTQELGHCAVLMTSILNPCGRIRDIVAFLQICLVIQSAMTDLGQIRNPRTPRVHTETPQASSEKQSAIWTCTTLGIQHRKEPCITTRGKLQKNIQRVTPCLALTRVPEMNQIIRTGAPPS